MVKRCWSQMATRRYASIWRQKNNYKYYITTRWSRLGLSKLANHKSSAVMVKYSKPTRWLFRFHWESWRDRRSNLHLPYHSGNNRQLRRWDLVTCVKCYWYLKNRLFKTSCTTSLSWLKIRKIVECCVSSWICTLWRVNHCWWHLDWEVGLTKLREWVKVNWRRFFARGLGLIASTIYRRRASEFIEVNGETMLISVELTRILVLAAVTRSMRHYQDHCLT